MPYPMVGVSGDRKEERKKSGMHHELGEHEKEEGGSQIAASDPQELHYNNFSVNNSTEPRPSTTSRLTLETALNTKRTLLPIMTPTIARLT